MLSRAANHKGIAGIQRIRFFAGDMHPTPGSDDDNLCELMRMQSKGFLRVAPFDSNGKSIRMKPIFPLEG